MKKHKGWNFRVFARVRVLDNSVSVNQIPSFDTGGAEPAGKLSLAAVRNVQHARNTVNVTRDCTLFTYYDPFRVSLFARQTWNDCLVAI